jgi:hypothetical protein|tara:strand:+ start:5297 stop:5497 length:201 start_codon:yes stop_codon:yes gene_type:complete
MTVTTKITKRVKVFIDKYGKPTTREKMFGKPSGMQRHIRRNTNVGTSGEEESIPTEAETTAGSKEE